MARTNKFNLTQLEQNSVEQAISALHSMIHFEGDFFKHLVGAIFELIYGEEKAEKIIEFLENEFDKDDDDATLLIQTFDEGKFFKVNKDVKEVKELFTKINN